MELTTRQTFENRRPAISPLGGATLLLLVTFVLSAAPAAPKPAMIVTAGQPRITEVSKPRIQPGGAPRIGRGQASPERGDVKFFAASLPSQSGGVALSRTWVRGANELPGQSPCDLLRCELLDMPPPACSIAA